MCYKRKKVFQNLDTDCSTTGPSARRLIIGDGRRSWLQMQFKDTNDPGEARQTDDDTCSLDELWRTSHIEINYATANMH